MSFSLVRAVYTRYRPKFPVDMDANGSDSLTRKIPGLELFFGSMVNRNLVLDPQFSRVWNWNQTHGPRSGIFFKSQIYKSTMGFGVMFFLYWQAKSWDWIVVVLLYLWLVWMWNRNRVCIQSLYYLFGAGFGPESIICKMDPDPETAWF